MSIQPYAPASFLSAVQLIVPTEERSRPVRRSTQKISSFRDKLQLASL